MENTFIEIIFSHIRVSTCKEKSKAKESLNFQMAQQSKRISKTIKYKANQRLHILTVLHIMDNYILDKNMGGEFFNQYFKNIKVNGNQIKNKDKEFIQYSQQASRFKEVSKIINLMEKQLKIHIIIFMMENMLTGEGKDKVNKLIIGKEQIMIKLKMLLNKKLSLFKRKEIMINTNMKAHF